MKQNIEIEVPEGYKAVYNETTKKVDIVKISTEPKTWEEFCESHPIQKGESGIAQESVIIKKHPGRRDSNSDRNVCTSVEEAEAFLALMQLRQLRKAWIGDWEPCWEGEGINLKFAIVFVGGAIYIDSCVGREYNLTFPTEQMAKAFANCFEHLIKQARPIL